MTLDLTEDEKLALAALLKRTLEDDRYPLSPRLRPLKSILAKLEPRDLLLTLSRAEAIKAFRAAHRLVPVTTISACRPPH
jgi:hypothetical protein